MMKLVIAGTASLALILGGCAGSGNTTGGTTATSGLTFQEVVQDAILACQGLCGVAPTLETITTIAIAAAGGSAAAALSEQAAQQAATAFCNGVSGRTTTVAGHRAVPRLRATPRALANGVFDYGTITVNGKIIDLKGVPQS